MRQLAEVLEVTIQKVLATQVTIELTRPDEQFGDFATNVSLQLSRELSRPPREIADAIVAALDDPMIAEAAVAGPGFINIKLSQAALIDLAARQPEKLYDGQTIVAEYSDPNPFKVLHAGHLYTSVVGDAIANLLANAGGIVSRVNYGGDVGLHVAKNMWAIIQELGGEQPGRLDEIPEAERSDWLSRRYVEGNQAYEDNESAKQAIVELNKRIYQIHTQADQGSPLAKIYWTARQWSYDYFDKFYAAIGVKFDKYYPESQTASMGKKIVEEQLEKGVYSQSDGAVVFRGEDYDLHTRVFINSAGLPTYEAKEVGLIMTKWQDYHFDKSVIITGNDIVEYMKVVLKSIEQFEPKLVEATTHLAHGIVKLAGGVKMSSRLGNTLRAVDVLEAANQANQQLTGKDNPDSALAAVKYAFLKQRLGGDIIYDPDESVAIEGNSGPYVQYAHARARSILAKGSAQSLKPGEVLQADERSLLRKLGEYSEVVERATAEFMPHHICTYLYELAQSFNRFYEANRVIGDPREATRLWLVKNYAETLKRGLQLLGLPAPDKM